MSFVSKLKGAIHHAKDAGSSMAAEHFVAKQLEPFGELKHLQINSREKNIAVEVLLKGERDTLWVEIEDYEFINNDGLDYFIIKRAAASREWITTLLQSVIVGRRNLIPPQYSRMARMVLTA